MSDNLDRELSEAALRLRAIVLKLNERVALLEAQNTMLTTDNERLRAMVDMLEGKVS